MILRMNKQRKQKKSAIKEFKWTPEAEVHLLQAMYGLRPIGVSCHFVMLTIWEKFKARIGIDVPLRVVKEKISTWYNLEAANDIFSDEEFPEEAFSLPIDEFPEVATTEISKSVESDSKKRND